MVSSPLDKLKSFFRSGSARTQKAKFNITVSFAAKGFSMIVSFIIVPLTLGYVGKTEYGIWITLSSIISYFTFFDLGLGNGFRNKFAEAIALDKHELARIYVSTIYSVLFIISFVLFLVFVIFYKYIDWNRIFNTKELLSGQLGIAVLLVFSFFLVEFVLKLISSMLQATQNYAINDLLGVISQLVGLIGIVILIYTTTGSLFNLCLVYGGKSMIVLLIATLVLFLKKFRHYRPSLKFVRIREIKPLMNLGMKFFFNQVIYLVIYESSIILIAQFFGPDDVTIYNLALKYISITSIGYMMILTPFISAFTEAYTINDFSWIKTIIKYLNKIWLFSSLLTVLLVFGAKLFFRFWVGDKIQVPLEVIILLAINTIVTNWSATFTLFLNGIGKIELQMYLLTIGAIVFISMSFLLHHLGFGLSSIILPQIFMSLIYGILFPFQYKKLMNRNAVGIWNK